MILELLMWTVFIATAILLVLWILTSPPADRKTRTAPENEDRYAKNRFIASKVPKDADVIIIGSGMGGMGAASILSKYGQLDKIIYFIYFCVEKNKYLYLTL